jgi:hypothetical protein
MRRDQRHSPGGAGNEEGMWRERAAFSLAVEFRDTSAGREWRTSAYHEERDARVSWEGLPGAPLVSWLVAQTAPHEASAPAEPDDFKQISGIRAATERRLHEAGITTYAQLAACSPTRLAELTGKSVEQVTRYGWAERAARLAAARVADSPASDTPADDRAAQADLADASMAKSPTLGAPVEERDSAATEDTPLAVEAPVEERDSAATEDTPLAVEAPAEERDSLIETMAAEPAAASVLPDAPAPLAEDVTPSLPASGDLAGADAAPPLEADDAVAHTLPALNERAALIAEVLLDEQGDVADLRLLRGDQPAADWPEGYIARFFVDAPEPTQAAEEVLIMIEDVDVRRVDGPTPRLRAEGRVRLNGLGAERVAAQRLPYLAHLLAYDLGTTQTSLVHSETGRLDEGLTEYRLVISTGLPPVGRYQLLLALIVPDCDALGAASGPVLRVTP